MDRVGVETGRLPGDESGWTNQSFPLATPVRSFPMFAGIGISGAAALARLLIQEFF